MGACSSSQSQINFADIESCGFKSDVDNKGASFTSKLVKEHTTARLEDSYDLWDSQSLGKGAFGVVRTCVRRGSTDTYALKTITMMRLSTSELAELLNEIRILKSLDHPNICRLFETFFDRDAGQMHMVMELLAGGNLWVRLRDRGTYYDEPTAARYMRSMVSATLYCHSHGVCHRDIKLENFVLESNSDDAELKLIDFGLSATVRKGSELMKSQVGTLPFMAPELLANRGYTSACDVWALGAATYELLSGFRKRPFNQGKIRNVSYEKQLKRIMRTKTPPTPVRDPPLSSEAEQLIRAMLVINPRDRITAEQALKHPWLQQPGALRAKAEKEKVSTRNSLDAFRKMSLIERLALDSVAFSLPAAKVENLRLRFLALDTDASGTLSRDELRAAFTQNELTDEALNDVFSKMAISANEEVTYTEFIAAMLAMRAEDRNSDDDDDESVARAAFSALDLDNSGMISTDELSFVLKQRGAQAQLHQEVGREDEVSYDQFRSIIGRISKKTNQSSDDGNSRDQSRTESPVMERAAGSSGEQPPRMILATALTADSNEGQIRKSPEMLRQAAPEPSKEPSDSTSAQ